MSFFEWNTPGRKKAMANFLNGIKLRQRIGFNKCPNCGIIYEVKMMVCPKCGHKA